MVSTRKFLWTSEKDGDTRCLSFLSKSSREIGRSKLVRRCCPWCSRAVRVSGPIAQLPTMIIWWERLRAQGLEKQRKRDIGLYGMPRTFVRVSMPVVWEPATHCHVTRRIPRYLVVTSSCRVVSNSKAALRSRCRPSRRHPKFKMELSVP